MHEARSEHTDISVPCMDSRTFEALLTHDSEGNGAHYTIVRAGLQIKAHSRSCWTGTTQDPAYTEPTTHVHNVLLTHRTSKP